MYKPTTKIRLEQSKHILYRIKRRIICILAAVLIGVGNAINEEEHSVMGKSYQIEQHDREEK